MNALINRLTDSVDYVLPGPRYSVDKCSIFFCTQHITVFLDNHGKMGRSSGGGKNLPNIYFSSMNYSRP